MPTSRNFSKSQDQKRLPLVNCKCGKAILVIPDVKAMDKAIELHLGTCPVVKQSRNKSQCTNKLSDFLIAQVLGVASTKTKPESEQSTKNATQANHHSSIIDPKVS